MARAINDKIFGMNINPGVMRTLELRQQLQMDDDIFRAILDSSKGLNFGERYRDTDSVFYSTGHGDENRLISPGTLSQQVPFARMWTAVQLSEWEPVFDGVPTGTTDRTLKCHDQASHEYIEENPHMWCDENQYDSWVQSQSTDFEMEGYENTYTIFWKSNPIVSKVYEIGNNTLNQTDETRLYSSLNDPGVPFTHMEDYEVTDGLTAGKALPKELESNYENAPQSGIKGITSRTEDMYGYTTTTTVTFTVSNFHDYEKIFMRYFMKPGAQLFVDFGWSNSDLYDINCVAQPRGLNVESAECIDDSGIDRGDTLEARLWGDQGYVTKSNGNLHTIHGIVSKWDSKLNVQGGYDCSVDITSKGAAMMSNKFSDVEVFRRKLINKLDTFIIETTYDDFNYSDALYNSQEAEMRKKLGEDASQEEIDEYRANIRKNILVELRKENSDAMAIMLAMKYLSKTAWGNLPAGQSLVSGIYWNLKGKDLTNSENIYVQWGVIEDFVINGQFAFGQTKSDFLGKGKNLNPAKNHAASNGNLEVSFNSRNSFVRLADALYNKQILSYNTSGFKYLFPETWRRTQCYNARVNRDPNIAFCHPADDFKEKRIPLRDIFIQLKVVKDALRLNTNVRGFVNTMLKEINALSQGVWSLRVVNKSGGAGNELAVVDSNFDGLNVLPDVIEEPLFDGLFTFSPYSPGSQVINFDYAFKTPSNKLMAMLAIEHSKGYTFGNNNIDFKKFMNLKTVNDDGLEDNNLLMRYLPDAFAGTELVREERSLSDDIDENYSKISDYDPMLTKKDGTYTFDSMMQEKSDGLSMIQMGDLLKFKEQITEPNDSFNTVENYELFPNVEFYSEKKKTKKSRKQKAEIVNTQGEWFDAMARTYIFEDELNTMLPIEASLKIYGLGGIDTGNLIKIDYIPEGYRKQCYWQVTKVTHDINSMTWSTSLQLMLKYRTKLRKKQSNALEPVLSKKYMENLGLMRWGERVDGIAEADSSAPAPVPSKCFENFRPWVEDVRTRRSVLRDLDGIYTAEGKEDEDIQAFKYQYDSRTIGQLVNGNYYVVYGFDQSGYHQDGLRVFNYDFDVSNSKYQHIFNRDGSAYIDNQALLYNAETFENNEYVKSIMDVGRNIWYQPIASIGFTIPKWWQDGKTTGLPTTASGEAWWGYATGTTKLFDVSKNGSSYGNAGFPMFPVPTTQSAPVKMPQGRSTIDPGRRYLIAHKGPNWICIDYPVDGTAVEKGFAMATLYAFTKIWVGFGASEVTKPPIAVHGLDSGQTESGLMMSLQDVYASPDEGFPQPGYSAFDNNVKIEAQQRTKNVDVQVNYLNATYDQGLQTFIHGNGSLDQSHLYKIDTIDDGVGMIKPLIPLSDIKTIDEILNEEVGEYRSIDDVDEFIFGNKDSGLNGTNGKIVITKDNLKGTTISRASHTQRFTSDGKALDDPYNLGKLKGSIFDPSENDDEYNYRYNFGGNSINQPEVDNGSFSTDPNSLIKLQDIIDTYND